VPLLTALELDRFVGTAISLCLSLTVTLTSLVSYCHINRLDLLQAGAGSTPSLISSTVVAGPLPLEALVKRVKLISIYTTIAFADKGKYCPVFVKGLTRFKCVLDSTVNRPVLLIGLLGYCNRPSLVGVSKLCIM
jgi:hypothetical protein